MPNANNSVIVVLVILFIATYKSQVPNYACQDVCVVLLFTLYMAMIYSYWVITCAKTIGMLNGHSTYFWTTITKVMHCDSSYTLHIHVTC